MNASIKTSKFFFESGFGVGDALGFGVALEAGVADGEGFGVGDGFGVGLGEGDADGDGFGVAVGDGVGFGVAVGAGDGVAVGAGVDVGVAVADATGMIAAGDGEGLGDISVVIGPGGVIPFPSVGVMPGVGEVGIASRPAGGFATIASRS